MAPVPSEARGILTVCAMALADAVVKLSSAALSLWQIWVLRSALTLPVPRVLPRGALRPAGLGWVILRSGLLALMYLGIYGAMPRLDLSVIGAERYTGPLFIAGLAVLALGERITAQQGVALLGAFLGVLIVLRPLASGFTPLALLPVLSARRAGAVAEPCLPLGRQCGQSGDPFRACAEGGLPFPVR